ncbi:proton ATPase [Conidiobolus coronatus NRRL 28638]|uniref:Plasma membrane ATPase n=1 Tax=Conidiobolus coronatus (strain ATCC 28846 / CBS 209.66 / NRRL 28638) TaxID=796925 RepID=A0A137PIB6_CONC2|nr:proton ATPase [Conidiobolus coronatus NRRL 28638]|eukprot:KXN74725.1 proton ATPase [Conidiobolus coronatus NRRL 28638]
METDREKQIEVASPQERALSNTASSSDEKRELIKEHVHVEVMDTIDPELEPYLTTDPKAGLTTAEAEERLKKFGKNEIPEKKSNPVLKFLSYFTGAIAFLIELALILSGVVQDWVDFGIIAGLLVLNAIIGFAEEAKAENALNALKKNLALRAKVVRDGVIKEVDAVDLVPGDILSVRIGDIAPADCKLLGKVASFPTDSELLVDQSALTGESLPLEKKEGAIVFASSTMKRGRMVAVVVNTGLKTFIGRAANLMAITKDEGHFQKIVNQIGNFLVVITIVLVVIIFIVMLLREGTSQIVTVLQDVVVLTVAAIPVGLPTVLSVTMAVGAKQLAAKKVIVKRLTAVEEMASVSILCSDKTGTLTLNELTLDEPYLTPGYTNEELLLDAFLSSESGANDPIELAIRHAACTQVPALKDHADGNKHNVDGYEVLEFVPFNPNSKRTEATVRDLTRNVTFKVAKGAPQVIVDLAGGDSSAVRAVNEFAGRGLRALGVARTLDDDINSWVVVGMISLLDPPRPDSAETIAKCIDYGVAVKMITGDQLIIAKEVAHRLGMQRAILDAHKLVDTSVEEDVIAGRCQRADGFAQVIPEHKYRVVELLQEKGFLVGMTGDGVNDAPALKKANVGIAVHGCTDAARSAADIVLLAPGLSTIVDGVITSREIFQRMRSYALYRITSTIHFLVFFFIVMLAFSWKMPAVLLIFIAVLNDLATLVISVDNTQITHRPDKWRIGQLITLSFILALCICVMSFAHFFTARDAFHVNDGQLQTIMYLHISSCPHFVIFSTRVPGYFWTNLPSWIFFCAVMGTQVFAMLISVLGVPGLTTAIGWGWGFSIIALSLAWFIVLDFVKVQVLRVWSYELTVRCFPTPSRRHKLKEQKQRIEVEKRLNTSVKKVKLALTVVEAIGALSKEEKN